MRCRGPGGCVRVGNAHPWSFAPGANLLLAPRTADRPRHLDILSSRLDIGRIRINENCDIGLGETIVLGQQLLQQCIIRTQGRLVILYDRCRWCSASTG